jgi:hypothetical protein
VSCSSNEDVPVIVPSETPAQAVLDGGSIIVTWPSVVGSGITYNVYRNDNPEKINTAPLTEAKFTDVLTATGSYTYIIKVNLSGQESPKGLASGKVVLYLPKTITYENYDYSTSNGVTSATIDKDVSVLTYDSVNITKLISNSFTNTNTGNTTVSKMKVVYTYTGNLITKKESLDAAGVVMNSTVYVYNDKNKMTSETFTGPQGNVYKYVYVYNDDGTVTVTQYRTSVSGVVSAFGYTTVCTFLNGNMVKYVASHPSTNDDSTETRTFVYDAKNKPDKYILGFSNLFGGIANLNNMISEAYTYSLGTSSILSTSFTSEFTYDANGNVLTEKTFSKQDNLPEQLTRTTTYTY